jgi:hypothetical protein
MSEAITGIHSVSLSRAIPVAGSGVLRVAA